MKTIFLEALGRLRGQVLGWGLALFLLGVVAVLTVVFARFLQPRQVVAD